jgi:hypothetical protein
MCPCAPPLPPSSSAMHAWGPCRHIVEFIGTVSLPLSALIKATSPDILQLPPVMLRAAEASSASHEAATGISTSTSFSGKPPSSSSSSFSSPGFVCWTLVMEHMSEGNLFERLACPQPAYTMEQAMNWLTQVTP